MKIMSLVIRVMIENRFFLVSYQGKVFRCPLIVLMKEFFCNVFSFLCNDSLFLLKGFFCPLLLFVMSNREILDYP